MGRHVTTGTSARDRPYYNTAPLYARAHLSSDGVSPQANDFEFFSS